MRHKGLVIALFFAILIGGSFLMGMIMYFVLGAERDHSSIFGSEGVGIVTVEGVIMSSDKTLEELEQFRKNSNVKSVVLRVDSPGGAVAASQEIYEAVRSLAEKKPVITSMGSVAASGGYYISCGATKILANPGTTTGSIGVRLEHMMIGDLLDWAKIKHETLKSGRLKDLMPFDKPISPEAREILQGILDDMHEQFKSDVAKSRGLDKDSVDEIADGRVFTGKQALTLNLVDELGGFTAAVNRAGKLGNIDGYPKLIYPKGRSRFLERMLSEIKSFLSARPTGGFGFLQPMALMKGGRP